MRSGPIVRAARLGFSAEPREAGVVFVRRRTMACGDLGPAAGSGVVALDIEAVPLGGGHLAAFLAGTAREHSGRVAVEQFLLADPGEEAAMLLALGASIRGRHLATYNGRAFDLRILASRCVANGIHPACLEPALHDDLLAPARRRFRAALPSCSLREVERAVLGVERGADVAGSEGPARYRAWLRGAAARILAGVVTHNETDTVSTLRLWGHVGVRASLAG